TGNCTIEMYSKVDETDCEVCISMRDNGTPFDPFAKEDPDITLSADEREIGGLGIYMVKNIMDTVSYEYKQQQNVVTMTKKWQR
ncbi:MAG: ATP-binding protein, partial [Wujia sp.]